MDPLAPLILAFYAEGRPRVWSLVITVFGDSVQHRGGRIASSRLQKLLGRVGVEPGALRTALSRLRRDGWVDSLREGRNSFHRLSAGGLARFAPATERIYAPPRKGPVPEWTLALGAEGGLPLGAGLSLHPGGLRGAAADCAVTGQLETLAPAMRETLLDPAHRAALEALFTDIDTLDGVALAPLDAAAARTLLIHRWRRLVLRWPEIPAGLLPEPLDRRDPRAEVARLYAALSPAAEAWFDTPLGDLPALPPPGAAWAARFGGALSAREPSRLDLHAKRGEC
ncbi:MAG: PaaX family transcriptional regulator C-terminal domain-containing protein [Paracoccaceae bacterium]